MKDGAKYTVSPKGKRRLDFPTKTRSKTKLPLIGKTIYLDVKESKHVKRLEADLKKLGGTIEEFVSKDINYLITTQPRPRVPKDRDDVTNPLSPAAPSPFSCEPSPSPLHTDERLIPTATRGKALAERARIQSRQSSTLLDNATKWGVKIVTLEGAFKWIEKELAKLPKTSQTSSKKASKTKCVAKYKTFKTPFLKVEVSSHLYRPLTQQLEVWPRLNVDTPRGSCPFDGTLIDRGDHSLEERGELMPAQVDIPSAETPQEEKDGLGSNTTKATTEKSAKKSEQEPPVDLTRIITAGELRRRREQKRRQERKRGYCECCHVAYEDMDKHVRDDQHRAYVRDKSNYQPLEKLINTGPGVAGFLTRCLQRDLESTRKTPSLSGEEKEPTPVSPAKQTRSKVKHGFGLEESPLGSPKRESKLTCVSPKRGMKSTKEKKTDCLEAQSTIKKLQVIQGDNVRVSPRKYKHLSHPSADESCETLATLKREVKQKSSPLNMTGNKQVQSVGVRASPRKSKSSIENIEPCDVIDERKSRTSDEDKGLEFNSSSIKYTYSHKTIHDSNDQPNVNHVKPLSPSMGITERIAMKNTSPQKHLRGSNISNKPNLSQSVDQTRTTSEEKNVSSVTESSLKQRCHEGRESRKTPIVRSPLKSNSSNMNSPRKHKQIKRERVQVFVTESDPEKTLSDSSVNVRRSSPRKSPRKSVKSSVSVSFISPYSSRSALSFANKSPRKTVKHSVSDVVAESDYFMSPNSSRSNLSIATKSSSYRNLMDKNENCNQDASRYSDNCVNRNITDKNENCNQGTCVDRVQIDSSKTGIDILIQQGKDRSLVERSSDDFEVCLWQSLSDGDLSKSGPENQTKISSSSEESEVLEHACADSGVDVVANSGNTHPAESKSKGSPAKGTTRCTSRKSVGKVFQASQSANKHSNAACDFTAVGMPLQHSTPKESDKNHTNISNKSLDGSEKMITKKRTSNRRTEPMALNDHAENQISSTNVSAAAVVSEKITVEKCSDINSELQWQNSETDSVYRKTVAERIKERADNKRSSRNSSYNLNTLIKDSFVSRQDSVCSLKGKHNKKLKTAVSRLKSAKLRSSASVASDKVVNKYRQKRKRNLKSETTQGGYQGDDEREGRNVHGNVPVKKDPTVKKSGNKYWYYVTESVNDEASTVEKSVNIQRELQALSEKKRLSTPDIRSKRKSNVCSQEMMERVLSKGKDQNGAQANKNKLQLGNEVDANLLINSDKDKVVKKKKKYWEYVSVEETETESGTWSSVESLTDEGPGRRLRVPKSYAETKNKKVPAFRQLNNESQEDMSTSEVESSVRSKTSTKNKCWKSNPVSRCQNDSESDALPRDKLHSLRNRSATNYAETSGSDIEKTSVRTETSTKNKCWKSIPVTKVQNDSESDVLPRDQRNIKVHSLRNRSATNYAETSGSDNEQLFEETSQKMSERKMNKESQEDSETDIGNGGKQSSENKSGAARMDRAQGSLDSPVSKSKNNLSKGSEDNMSKSVVASHKVTKQSKKFWEYVPVETVESDNESENNLPREIKILKAPWNTLSEDTATDMSCRRRTQPKSYVDSSGTETDPVPEVNLHREKRSLRRIQIFGKYETFETKESGTDPINIVSKHSKLETTDAATMPEVSRKEKTVKMKSEVEVQVPVESAENGTGSCVLNENNLQNIGERSCTDLKRIEKCESENKTDISGMATAHTFSDISGRRKTSSTMEKSQDDLSNSEVESCKRNKQSHIKKKYWEYVPVAPVESDNESESNLPRELRFLKSPWNTLSEDSATGMDDLGKKNLAIYTRRKMMKHKSQLRDQIETSDDDIRLNEGNRSRRRDKIMADREKHGHTEKIYNEEMQQSMNVKDLCNSKKTTIEANYLPEKQNTDNNHIATASSVLPGKNVEQRNVSDGEMVCNEKIHHGSDTIKDKQTKKRTSKFWYYVAETAADKGDASVSDDDDDKNKVGIVTSNGSRTDSDSEVSFKLPRTEINIITDTQLQSKQISKNVNSERANTKSGIPSKYVLSDLQKCLDSSSNIHSSSQDGEEKCSNNLAVIKKEKQMIDNINLDDAEDNEMQSKSVNETKDVKSRSESSERSKKEHKYWEYVIEVPQEEEVDKSLPKVLQRLQTTWNKVGKDDSASDSENALRRSRHIKASNCINATVDSNGYDAEKHRKEETRMRTAEINSNIGINDTATSDTDRPGRSSSPTFGSSQCRMKSGKVKNTNSGRSSSPVFNKSPLAKQKKCVKSNQENSCAGSKISIVEFNKDYDSDSSIQINSMKSKHKIYEDVANTSEVSDQCNRPKKKIRISKTIRDSFRDGYEKCVDSSLEQRSEASNESNTVVNQNKAFVKNRREANDLVKTPTKILVVETPGSGHSNTPRSERRKRWKRKQGNLENNGSENSSDRESKKRRLDKLKYVIEEKNQTEESPHSGGKTIKQKLDVSFEQSKNISKVSSQKERKDNCENLNMSLPLKWNPLPVEHDETYKVKLNGSWSLLTDRSASKLLSSDGEEEEFDGFTEDTCELPSDLSYEECSEVEIPKNSEHDWVVDEEIVPDSEEEDEGKAGKHLNQEEFNKYLNVTFSSPGKPSDSSWVDACDMYINKSLTRAPDTSSFKPIESSMYFSSTSPWRSPRKKYNCDKKLTGTPTKTTGIRSQNLVNSAELDNDFGVGLLSQTPPKRKKAIVPKTVTCDTDRVEDSDAEVETVDEDIQFNYRSPQKFFTQFSPLRVKNGEVVERSSPRRRLCVTSTPTASCSRARSTDKPYDGLVCSGDETFEWDLDRRKSQDRKLLKKVASNKKSFRLEHEYSSPKKRGKKSK